MAKNKRNENDHGILPYPKRHTSWARQELVTILVGSEQVPFQIYASKLEEQSPTILSRIHYDDDPCGQSRGATLLMRDVDEQTMDIVVHWLYTGQLCKAEAGADSVEAKAQKEDIDDDDFQGIAMNNLAGVDANAKTPRESSETPTIADPVTPAPSSSQSAHSTPNRRSASLAFTQSTDASAATAVAKATDHAKTTSNLEYADIFSVYKFALQYYFPTLKLEALKCWQRRCSIPHAQPESTLISKIFNLPKDDLQLRRQVARQYALEYCHESMPQTIEKAQEKLAGLHPDFFPLMMYFQGSLFQHQVRRIKYSVLWCDFHDHKTSEEGWACVTARQAELQDMDMRKGKRSWQEADRLLKKVQHQRKVLSEPANMSKKISSLMLDDDGIIIGMKGGKE